MSVATKSVAAGDDAARSAVPKKAAQIGTLLGFSLLGLLGLMWIVLAVCAEFRRGRLVSSHIGEKAAHENILTEAIGV